MNLVNTKVTMTSREIAELTGKRHSDITRTITFLINEGALNGVSARCVDPQNKQEYNIWHFDKNNSLILVARLEPKFMALIIKRWQELEVKVQPVNLLNLPILEKLNIIEQAKITLGNENTKQLFPLIWQTISDGVQNDIVAMFDSSKPLLKSTVAIPLDVVEIAKRNNITIPSNFKSSVGKYVKKHSKVPAVVTERVINGSIRQSNAYTNYDEVLNLIKNKLNLA